MTLDERGRRASRAIERSVEGVTAPELHARAPRPRLVYAPIAAVFALLVAGLVFLRATNVIGPTQSATLGKKVATIPLGHIPSAIVTDEFGDVWVASDADGLLLKVDPERDRVVGSIHVGAHASSLVLSGGFVWVASDPNGFVTQVDVATMHIVRRVHVAGPVTGLAVQNNLIWAATATGKLDAIDPGNGSVRHDFLVSSSVSGLVAAGGSLWTLEPQIGVTSDNVVLYVLRVDPRSGRVLRTLLIGETQGPSYLTAYAGAVWAASLHPGGLHRIDPSANSARTIDIPGLYIADLVSPNIPGSNASERTMWVIAGTSGFSGPNWYLLQVNTRTGDIVRRVTLDSEGVGPAAGPGTLWVGQSTSKSLLRFQLIER